MHRLKIFFRKQIITRCLLTKGWTLFALKRLAGTRDEFHASSRAR